jgi:type III secretion control protein HpaP
MTRIRSPRELRIAVAQRPAPGAAAGARFGQLLGQARQALGMPDRAAPDRVVPDDDQPSGGGARDDEAGQQGHGGGEDTQEPGAADAARTLPPPPRPRLPGTARPPAPRQAMAGAPDDTTRALGARLVAHCARAAGGDLVAEHLAERIARFCASPALERAGGRWEVMIELDPAILPHTRLHLVLSDDALSLRFDTRDARARQLICDNGAALRRRLEARLGARIAIHVEVN